MMTIKDLEEGKQNIITALQNVGLDYDSMVGIPNKCSECNYRYMDNGNQLCVLNDKVVNAYSCYKDLESSIEEYLEEENEARELPEYEDDFHSSTLCHDWQIGEKEL